MIMAIHNVLLVCGSGASSGFMAANIRKAASERGIEITVNAKSESNIEDHVSEIDCLLIGPHLASLMSEMQDKCKAYPIRIAIIEKEAYAHLNGDMVLDQILTLFGEK